MFRNSSQLFEGMFRPCLESVASELQRDKQIYKQTIETQLIWQHSKYAFKNTTQGRIFPVYIRVTYRRQTAYIKTDKMITKRELSVNNEVMDAFVLQFCTKAIIEYQERLNRHDIRNWTVKQMTDYLTTPEEVLPFSEYARKHIDRLIDNGQETTPTGSSDSATVSQRPTASAQM